MQTGLHITCQSSKKSGNYQHLIYDYLCNKKTNRLWQKYM